MPDILFVCGIFLIIPIIVFFDTERWNGFMTSIFIAILWFLWCGIYLMTPWETETAKVKIYTSENIDFFIIDDCFHNTNALLGKDFQDGDTINLKRNKTMFYKGVFPCRDQQWRLSDVSVESTTSP